MSEEKAEEKIYIFSLFSSSQFPNFDGFKCRPCLVFGNKVILLLLEVLVLDLQSTR
jgi:hypothetical protein